MLTSRLPLPGVRFPCATIVYGRCVLSSDVCRKCALSSSCEWLVLVFLLWLIQSTSLSGRSTLDRCCLRLFPLRMPVELVRGGIAFGEAKGWDVEGMLEGLCGGCSRKLMDTKVETHSPAGFYSYVSALWARRPRACDGMIATDPARA